MVTGSSKFDDLLHFKDPRKGRMLRVKYGIPVEKKVVLVLTSWFVEARLWTVEERRFFVTEIVKASINLGDIQLIFKLHAPHENMEDYHKILDDYPGSPLIFNFESLHELISLKVTGSALRSKIVDGSSPILYGFNDNLAIFASNPPVFGLSNMAGGGGGGRRNDPDDKERPTGRGTVDDPDIPQGRSPAEIPEEPHAEKWQALPLTDEQMRNPINVIPAEQRPRVVLRYANANELLVSGLLDNGSELAQHAAVIDSPYGQGHVVLFSNNPFWRAETKGSYFLVFNAILNFDSLNAGRKADAK